MPFTVDADNFSHDILDTDRIRCAKFNPAEGAGNIRVILSTKGTVKCT